MKWVQFELETVDMGCDERDLTDKGSHRRHREGKILVDNRINIRTGVGDLAVPENMA
jgi:hypothetical protein